jgi:hypothetical protein
MSWFDTKPISTQVIYLGFDRKLLLDKQGQAVSSNDATFTAHESFRRSDYTIAGVVYGALPVQAGPVEV